MNLRTAAGNWEMSDQPPMTIGGFVHKARMHDNLEIDEYSRESPDCHRGLQSGNVTLMVNLYERC